MAEPFIGQIIMFGGNFAPRGWALCDGTLIAINQNQALFSILGTTYGGDGRTNFALPDLRSRSPVHAGSGPGLSTIRLGQKGGAETETLSTNNMPSHNHPANLRGINQSANSTEFSSNALANSSTDMYFSSRGSNTSFVNLQSDSVTVDNTGGGQSFNIRSPYQAVNFIIALVGTFPSRN